jgi:hypothetical protein
MSSIIQLAVILNYLKTSATTSEALTETSQLLLFTPLAYRLLSALSLSPV